MKIVHLETVRLVRRTLVRPVGACGNCGGHNGEMWSGVMLTQLQAQNPAKVRAAWNAVNPNLIAASVDAPVIEAQS